MGTVDGFAIYGDGEGMAHVACCYVDTGGPWSFLRCNAMKSGGRLEPGTVDARTSYPTCLWCVRFTLP